MVVVKITFMDIWNLKWLIWYVPAIKFEDRANICQNGNIVSTAMLSNNVGKARNGCKYMYMYFAISMSTKKTATCWKRVHFVLTHRNRLGPTILTT